ncbi:ABC transporter permease [Demequina sp. NBRC 110054]|uniref:ABC transporter permease n=1 Tax=Demequina sp. NBRC 110054 TaxID=1570343 RepID=UPI00117861B4|nr:ABC transporter permease [Demequina sp. NBRC 110054]
MSRVMGWIPAGLIGVAGVLAGLAFGVIRNGDLGNAGEAFLSILFTTLAIGLYGGALVALPLATVAFMFRRISLRSDSIAWRTMLDLGADRGTIVRDQTVDGLRRGALTTGAGVLIGLVLAMTVPYFRPADEGVALPSLYALAGMVAAYVLLVAVTGGVHWLAARSATRPGPRPGVATGLEAEPPADRARMSRWTWLLIVAVAFSAGMLTADRFAPLRPTSPTTSAQVWLENTFTGFEVVANLGGLILAARAIAWATRRLAATLGRVLARATANRPSGLGLAAQIAADGLTRRSSLRSLATGAIGGVIAIAALSSVVSSVDAAENEVDAAFTMDYTVATVAWWTDTSLPSGAVDDAIDPAVLEALLADDSVIAVPYGVLLDDPFDWSSTTEHSGGAVLTGSGTSRASTLVVDPADLEVRHSDGLRPVGLQDGTATVGWGTPPWDEATFSDGRDDLFGLYGSDASAFVTRAWAEEAYGAVPVVGVILWPADAELPLSPDGLIQRGELWGEDLATLDAAVDAAGGDELATYVSDGSGTQKFASGFVGALTVLAIPLSVLGIGLVVALGNASVRDRRRELATLSALGASPRAVRTAPAIEVATTVLAACLVGIPAGTLVALTLYHPTLLQAGAPLDLSNTLWIMGWDLAHASFGTPLAVGAAALVVSTAAALLVGSWMARGTPVEELRTADKAGVR